MMASLAFEFPETLNQLVPADNVFHVFNNAFVYVLQGPCPFLNAFQHLLTVAMDKLRWEYAIVLTFYSPFLVPQGIASSASLFKGCTTVAREAVDEFIHVVEFCDDFMA